MMQTTATIHNLSTWHNHVLIVGRVKPGAQGNGGIHSPF